MSDPIVLTRDNVTEALHAAVEEKGENFVYSNERGQVAGEGETIYCNYVHNPNTEKECPGCIVGNVLNRLGVPLTTLSKRERAGANTLLVWLSNIGVVTYDDETLPAMLEHIQASQDSGDTWGNAVRNGLRYS